MDNIYTYVVDLPDGVDEAVMPCKDGYTVYISAKLMRPDQLKAYKHALRHIIRDDWSKTDVQKIEIEVRKK